MLLYYLGDIMKIEKIKKLKSGKYKLEIDNDKIITYDDVILNNNLLFNKEVDEELFNQLNIETRYYDVYNRVIKYNKNLNLII